MTDAPALDQDNQPPSPLLVTDGELLKLLNVPERTGRVALSALDADPLSGFPKRHKIWGGRRYWPAVLAYFERANGLTVPPPQPERGGHVRKASV